ncbi:glycoside hydrolase family 125 protein [Paenibacillus macerans]|uniref:glycoside hydrolase family 125 protein n=1 Tax=Paenibacillus macerans TaxID=44252 RepID=UPI003D3211DF
MLENRSIQQTIEAVTEKLAQRPKLARLFANCYPNTIETTVQTLEDGSTFVITGDIPAMWLRDSSAQVRHYLHAAKQDAALADMIQGVIARQIRYINLDPYANAFNLEGNHHGHKTDLTEHHPWVWERKYEIDSLCYPIQLAYLFWKATGREGMFDAPFKEAIAQILSLWSTEQRHEESPYTFERRDCPKTDTLANEGRGTKVGYTGMTWSGFRPSDDACAYGYLVPANMFAVVVLGYIIEINLVFFRDGDIERTAKRLQREIRQGIEKYAIVEHEKYGRIYAYETDGLGNHNLMDDANVPSLLALPYLGYCSAEDPLYRNTRRFILSEENPYYYAGEKAQGIGSPHTPAGYVWHIALAMQGLTSTDPEEIEQVLRLLETTDADTGFMHEGFDVQDPGNYTRPWFAWANSICSELIMKYAGVDA